MHRFFAELIAALRDLTSTTHPKALYLLRRHPEFCGKLDVFGALRQAIQEPLAVLGRKLQAGALRYGWMFVGTIAGDLFRELRGSLRHLRCAVIDASTAEVL